MKLIRDKLKSDGIKVDLVKKKIALLCVRLFFKFLTLFQSNYGLYVPPPVDVWCAEKAKLKAYKLNDNV